MIPTLPEISFDMPVSVLPQPSELAPNSDVANSNAQPFARVLQAVRAPQSAAPLAVSGAEITPEVFEAETVNLPERIDLTELIEPGNALPPTGRQLPVSSENHARAAAPIAPAKPVAQSVQAAPEVIDEPDAAALVLDEAALPDAISAVAALPVVSLAQSARLRDGPQRAALSILPMPAALRVLPPVQPASSSAKNPAPSATSAPIAAALSSLEFQLEQAAAPLVEAAKPASLVAESALFSPPVGGNSGTPTAVSVPAPAISATSPANIVPTPALANPPTTQSSAANIDSSIEQLVAVRDLARNSRPEMLVRHAEFGAVNIRFDASVPGDLRAVLTSRDPGLVPAVQSALAERAVVAASDISNNTGTHSQSRSSDNPASQQSSQSAGQQANYGSSPGSGQAPYQPYSAQTLRDGRSGAQASPQGGSADRSNTSKDRGLFA